MSDTTAKITVSKVDGHVRVVVQLPATLDVLSPNDQTRVIENAMWRAAESVGGFLDRERTTGSIATVSAEIRAA